MTLSPQNLFLRASIPISVSSFVVIIRLLILFLVNVGAAEAQAAAPGAAPSSAGASTPILGLPLQKHENMERKLVRELLLDYDTSVRPSRNATTALNVTFGLALTQIIDVDERNQILTTNCWLNQMWIDYSLQWNSTNYGGIKVVRIPADRVWRPDIILYNNADSQYNLAILSTNVIVSSEGNLTWLSTAIFKSSCQINVEYFPFDEQTCEMKFASWTYDGFQVNLIIQTEDGDLSNYVPNGEWDLIEMRQRRYVNYYSCCEEPYPDVTYSITLRRRPLFYVFNLILPCVLISGLALLSFYMPSDSGEKVTLGITTLLSMTVFLMVIGESMPPTSEKLPLIGLYYGVTISLVSFATGLSVVTLNIHHRGMRGRGLPRYMKVLIFKVLARALFLHMDFPGSGGATERKKSDQQPSEAVEHTRANEGRDSGFISRRLDVSDTWRVVYPNAPSTPPPAPVRGSTVEDSLLNNSWKGRPGSAGTRSSGTFSSSCIDCFNASGSSGSPTRGGGGGGGVRPTARPVPVMKVRGIPIGGTATSAGAPDTERLYSRDDSTLHTNKSYYFERQLPPSHAHAQGHPPAWERNLSSLLCRVAVTMEKNEARMQEQDRKDEIKLEWQQAALVIDRLLLWIFVVATIGATFGILYMSPHTKLFTF